MTPPNLPIKRIILVTSGIEFGSVSWSATGVSRVAMAFSCFLPEHDLLNEAASGHLE